MRGDRAKRLARCFPKGVIRLVEGAGGEVEAEVGDVRRDTCSREVLRHEVCGGGEVYEWGGEVCEWGGEVCEGGGRCVSGEGGRGGV